MVRWLADSEFSFDIKHKEDLILKGRREATEEIIKIVRG